MVNFAYNANDENLDKLYKSEAIRRLKEANDKLAELTIANTVLKEAIANFFGTIGPHVNFDIKWEMEGKHYTANLHRLLREEANREDTLKHLKEAGYGKEEPKKKPPWAK